MQQKYSDITLPSVVYSGTKTKSRDWEDMPSDWSDIRKNCPENSIALYAAHKDDYSAYDNLGFTATCVGGYNVFIDGAQYGSTYASGATCSITWSTSGITTGEYVSTPSALKAHKIWIKPATEGNNITAFHCVRVAASGEEEQGVLWEHFNLSNSINISSLNSTGNMGTQAYKNTLLTSCTAKNNKLNVNGYLQYSFFLCSNLEYLPVIDANNTSVNLGYFGFALCRKIKKIDIRNLKFDEGSYAFHDVGNLESLPKGIDYSSATYMSNYLTYAKNIKDFVFDISSATKLKIIQCFGNTSSFMSGFKGLRVSSLAPLNYTSPQINVSYTGMDRAALVQLFEDLPYNVGYTIVGNPTISSGIASGFSENNYLTLDNLPVDYEAMFTFTTDSSDITTVQTVFSFPQAFALEIAEGIVRTYNWSTGQNITIIPSSDLSTNTKYSIKVIRQDTKNYTISYSKNNGSFSEPISFVNTSTQALTSCMGVAINHTNQYMRGSIDLNNTYIKVNDVYWFRGQAAMTKTLNCVECTGNKLAIIGSPTVENGIASNFSENDSLRLFSVDRKSINEIVIKINLPSSALGSSSYEQALFGPISLYYYCDTTNFKYIGFNIGTDLRFTPDLEIEPDTDYWIKYTNDGTNCTSWYSTDGINYIQGDSVLTSTLTDNSDTFYIGSVYGYDWRACSGFIDLNETYIKANNKIVFDINHCLLPEDRAIATDKGWSLTLL